ncbi:MAG: hypothetical protein K6T83_20765 [Alicyclobacillus sp.]|nr:hypothetical protein [Alicyclobacillus sp.]
MRTMTKRALGAAAALMTALGALGAGSGAAAFAASKQPVQQVGQSSTQQQYHWAHFVVNGKTVAVAPFIVQNGEAYWPAPYVVRALNAAGFYAFWDPTMHWLALVTGRNLNSMWTGGANHGNAVLMAYGNGDFVSSRENQVDAEDPTNHRSTAFLEADLLRAWLDQTAYQQITDTWNAKSGVWSLTITAPSGLTADHIPIPPDPNDPLPKQALQFYRSIKVSVVGKYRVLAIPFYPMPPHYSPWWVHASAVRFNGQVGLQYSLDGGKTWNKSSDYDNSDPSQGGVQTLPKGVQEILVRAPVDGRVEVDLGKQIPNGGEGLGELDIYPCGKQILTTFSYKTILTPKSSK